MTKTKQRASANPKRPMPTDPDALLTKKEAAQVLGVTERWVKRAVTLRYFPVYHVGKLVRIRLGDLLAYRDEQRTEAAK
jgi:excisionase family DNA binding protein